ncbi:MAG TPA: chemotaxis protein CheW, partial [Thermoanaerobaculia bacterium]|nr:chemotaxis protein CheW [Thermoanaerobaculia bacterium]
MVDLAKIRKKAKEKKSGAAGFSPSDGGVKAAATPDERLQKFLAVAGSQRFPEEAIVETAADEIELLTFILGSERFAIDIDDVIEISPARPATRVPNAAHGTVGIFSLRGRIVTLLDIRSKLKQSPAKGIKDPRIVVVRDGKGLAGFEVDRVLRPSKASRSSIEPQPVVAPIEESECVRGVIRGDESLTIVLDLAKLM